MCTLSPSYLMAVLGFASVFACHKVGALHHCMHPHLALQIEGKIDAPLLSTSSSPP